MWPDLASTRELASVLDVLGAMITPAVLILASSSLLITTSSRSIRCVDRVRERAEELEALGKGQDEGTEQWFGLSPDGRWLAIRRNDGELRVFPVAASDGAMP